MARASRCIYTYLQITLNHICAFYFMFFATFINAS